MAVLNYAQLSDVKTYLGISWSSEDTSLAALLLQSYYLLNSMLGVDTLNETTKTEVVERIFWDWTFWLHNRPVTALLTLDGTSYTWVLNTDYQILHNRQLRVKDITDYMTSLEFYNITATYTAWYDRDAERTLDASAAVDNWDWTVGIPCTAHWFDVYDSITISGTANYDGTYTPSAIDSANVFSITATYNAETFSTSDTATSLTSWWPGDTMPDDLKLMQNMMIGWMRGQAGSEGIAEYKLGEENIKYWSASWIVESKDVPTFNNLLSRYKVQDVYSI